MDNIYVASGATAMVTATLIQLLKNAPLFPFMSRETGRINALVSVIAAGIATIGITYSFDFDQETGAFAMGFTGNVTDLAHGIGHWITQWCSQVAVYKGFIAPAEILGEMRAIQKHGLLQQPPQIKPDVPHVEPPINI